MKKTAWFHTLSTTQFNLYDLEYLFTLSDQIRKIDKKRDGSLFLKTLLSHKRCMLYFTQPSTRTFLSFQTACSILGMDTSEVRDPSLSSEKKGESVEDSLRTFSSYFDLIIMRSIVPGLSAKMARLLDETPRTIPIINAGSGSDEHPTQALLDLYTLSRSFVGSGGINGKTICMVGDLRRGRTVRSLARLLKNFESVHINFCSPKEYAILDDLREELKESSTVEVSETRDFLKSIAEADAIYMTRIQDEYDCRFESNLVDTSKYCLHADLLHHLKQSAVIMHPMPRREELDPRVDLDPRAEYWRQERNGMWIRAALIARTFAVDRDIINYDSESK